MKRASPETRIIKYFTLLNLFFGSEKASIKKVGCRKFYEKDSDPPVVFPLCLQ
jgi:hypothetical protein